MYAYVGGNPINAIDPWGLKAECCESDKVPIWVCRGDLGGDGTSVRTGALSHSYITCVEPSAVIPGDQAQAFGFHPRRFDESGNPIVGSGRIVRETRRNPSKADCNKRMVCPEEKKEMCSEGDAPYSYFLMLTNCHFWADGRELPPREGDVY